MFFCSGCIAGKVVHSSSRYILGKNFSCTLIFIKKKLFLCGVLVYIREILWSEVFYPQIFGYVISGNSDKKQYNMESQLEQIHKVREVVDTVLRRRNIILSFLLISIVTGLVLYLIIPKVYQSSALLIYQRQKISTSKMSPDEQGRLRDVVNTLSQIVVSRASLEKIIIDHKLYIEQREKMPMQDVIEIMRNHISIKPTKGSAFVVSFEGKDPVTVSRVANALAARFIEENLKYRQERASETSRYAQNELNMAKETLDKKEVVLRDYKLKYYNEMPEQREPNMARLNALQEQYQGMQESIQDLEKTRVLIHEKIAARTQQLENMYNAAASVNRVEQGPEGKAISNREQLEQLKTLRAVYLDKYTSKHPKIRVLDKRIDRLQEVVQRSREASKDAAAPVQAVDEKTGEVRDQALFDLQLQLKEVAFSIEKISKRMTEAEAQIDRYEGWIAAAPVREAEWSAITREYSELKRHYDYLVAQNLQASSAMNLELKQKGSQFRIEDPARRPHKPLTPNFVKIMGLAVFLGGGLGAGLVVAAEFLNTSIRSPMALELLTEVDVLCCVPNVALRNEVRKKRMWTIGSSVFFISAFVVLLGIVLFLYQKGVIVI